MRYLLVCLLLTGCWGSTTRTESQDHTQYQFSGTFDGKPFTMKGVTYSHGQSKTEEPVPPAVSGFFDTAMSTLNAIIPPPYNIGLAGLGALFFRQRAVSKGEQRLKQTVEGVDEFLRNPEVSDTVKTRLKGHLSSKMDKDTKAAVRRHRPV